MIKLFEDEFIHHLKSNQIEYIYYKSFGVALFKGENFLLCIRCGNNSYDDRGGHTHDDQLSIQFYSNNINLNDRVGNYIYTPMPEIRNLFRSFQLSYKIKDEDNISFNNQRYHDLFRLNPLGNYVINKIDNKNFEFQFSNKNLLIKKLIIIEDYKLKIIVESNKNISIINLQKYISKGYGKIQRLKDD